MPACPAYLTQLAQGVYSSITWLDKLSFAAAWLNRATGNETYLQQAQSYFTQFMADNSSVSTNT